MTTLGNTTNSYNGDGVLVKQVTGSTTTLITNDLVAGLSQPLVIQTGTQTMQSIYGHDRLFSTDQANVRSWYLSDGVGSVQATLDSSGALVTNPDYDAWGTVASSTTPTPFGFTGEYRDSATGFKVG